MNMGKEMRRVKINMGREGKKVKMNMGREWKRVKINMGRKWKRVKINMENFTYCLKGGLNDVWNRKKNPDKLEKGRKD